MNQKTQKLVNWVAAEKLRLESAGRTDGGQYQSILGWEKDAEKLNSLPDIYVFSGDNDAEDPRAWATRVLAADAVLRAYVRFGGPQP